MIIACTDQVNVTRWRRALAVVGSALLVAFGCGPSVNNGSTAGPGAESSAPAPTADRPAASDEAGAPPPSPGDLSASSAEAGARAGSPGDRAAPLPPTGLRPTRVVIPAIGVDAEIVGLDLRGPVPEVPTDFAQAGWYEQTRRPGEIGPAVIAGHIDSINGPAVFARLDELVAGDKIVVSGAGGETRTFVVGEAGQYPKEALPDEVFDLGQPVPELRLITCGGTFDRSSGHYRDNYVVYTELAASP